MTRAETLQNREHKASSKPFRILVLLSIVAVIVTMNVGGSWLANQINFQLFPRHDSILQAIVIGAVVFYIVLMAIPFMPGIEIGLALMLLLGSKGALLVYICTLIALSLSFAIGRMIPPRFVYGLLELLHLYKASALVRRLEPLGQNERLKLLHEKAPSKLAPFLLKHRYAAIAVALNIPGNALIGGGGGIGLITGMSKMIAFPAYIVLLAAAIAPVPLLFFFEII